MTTPDPEQIAAGLTKAQRGAMDAGYWVCPGGQPAFVVVKFTDPWPEGVAYFFTISSDRLTPLGIAVRNIVKDQPND